MRTFLVGLLLLVAATASSEPDSAVTENVVKKPEMIRSRELAGLQPQVLAVELKPRRAFSTIAAQSSIWCDGKQMVWPVGHQPTDERPYCRNGNSFTPTTKFASLDTNDVLNEKDGTTRIDRHTCVLMDVNRDGLDDIICVVG